MKVEALALVKKFGDASTSQYCSPKHEIVTRYLQLRKRLRQVRMRAVAQHFQALGSFRYLAIPVHFWLTCVIAITTMRPTTTIVASFSAAGRQSRRGGVRTVAASTRLLRSSGENTRPTAPAEAVRRCGRCARPNRRIEAAGSISNCPRGNAWAGQFRGCL
jgi:hypothetical protein